MISCTFLPELSGCGHGVNGTETVKRCPVTWWSLPAIACELTQDYQALENWGTRQMPVCRYAMEYHFLARQTAYLPSRVSSSCVRGPEVLNGYEGDWVAG